MNHSISVINTTVGSSDQAQKIAKRLVESQVAGCVQIDGPIQSVYRWEGKVCEEAEYRLSAKTVPNLVDTLMASLGTLHPYQTPELLVTSVECSENYFRWLKDQVADQSNKE